MTDYLKHKEMYDYVVFFEDVVADSESECKRLFDFLGIGHEHVPKALDALKEDSQQGTFGKRGKRPKIRQEQYDYLDSYLRSLDVDPRISCQMSIETLREIVC
jgi:hypothetical protein